jgi:hypothetical protein
MESLIQGAHMAQQYGLEDIKGMAPLLAFLSTTNPATLPQMVRAAGYAMPSLHSQLGMDPADILMDTTAIARAGATNTKSGTWVESFYQRLLPPDARLVSKGEYERRMFADRALGIVDAKGKSTLLGADGKIDNDLAKKTISEHAAAMDIVTRGNVLGKAFGKQGARGAALLMSPAVMGQSAELKREFPDFKKQYPTFMEDYANNSAIQKTRQTVQELTGVLADIGSVALPPVTQALHDFSDALKQIKSILPDMGGKDKDKDGVWGRVGAKAIEGAAFGGVGGMMFGGIGALPGAVVGGVLGGSSALIKEMTGVNDSIGKVSSTAAPTVGVLENLAHAISGLAAAAREGMRFGGVQTPSVPAPPSSGGGEKHSAVYLKGRIVGQLVTREIADRMGGATEGSAFHDSTRGAPASDLAWSAG